MSQILLYCQFEKLPKADGSSCTANPRKAPEFLSRMLSWWLLKMRNSFFAPRWLAGAQMEIYLQYLAKCMQITYFISLAVIIRFEDSPQSVGVMFEFRLSAVRDKRLAKVSLSLKIDAATTACLCDAVSLGHEFWALELHLSSSYVQWIVATSHLLLKTHLHQAGARQLVHVIAVQI